MLNTFPQLLYPFYAPLILRAGVAIAFAVVAYLQWSRAAELSQTRMPIVGRLGGWVWLSIVAHVVVALMLLFGYYTQIAALVGALMALKSAYWSRQYPLVFPLSRTANLLLLLICLSLVVSGAGALARDIPL